MQPDIVARQELKWNMVQLVSMLVLFGELFWTESGRQVIFMLLLFWVPVGFGFSFYVMFKGIRESPAAASRRITGVIGTRERVFLCQTNL